MDGETRHNHPGFQIDIENDLLPSVEKETKLVGPKIRNKFCFDWKKCQWTEVKSSNERHKFYSRTLLLAFPKNRPFGTLCYSEFPTQCLRYLAADDYDHTSPLFKVHLATILNKYPPLSYQKGDQENFPILLNLLLKANDTELKVLFVNKILAGKGSNGKDVLGLQIENEELVSKLIQTTPWEQIKDKIEYIIESNGFGYLYNWMRVYSFTGITDIAHKVIESSLVEVQNGHNWDYSKSLLWEKVFESVFMIEDIGQRWMERFLENEKVMTNIRLMMQLSVQVLSSNHLLSLKRRVVSLFINSIKGIKKLVSNSSKFNWPFDYLPKDFSRHNGHAKMILTVIKPMLNDEISFKNELQELCDYLINSSNSQIIGKVLYWLSSTESHESFCNTESFKMFLKAYLDDLNNYKVVFSNLDELTVLAETLSRIGSLSEPNTIFNFKGLKGLEESDLLCRLITELILRHEKCKELTNFAEMINTLSTDLFHSLSTRPVIQTHLMKDLILTMFNQEDLFEVILEKALQEREVINCLKEDGDGLIKSIGSRNKIIKSEGYKILLRVAVDNFENTIDQVRYGYKFTLDFIKLLFKESFYADVAHEFVSLKVFQADGLENMQQPIGESYLELLLKDLQKELSDNDFYIQLMLIRVRNLRSLKETGVPKLTWAQTEAVFPHPLIQEFLHSENVTFVAKFQTLYKAKKWIGRFAGYRRTYSFSAVARMNEGIPEAILQKERDIYQKSKDHYSALMSELKDLEEQLKTLKPNGTKRPADSPTEVDSYIPNKIQYIQHEQ